MADGLATRRGRDGVRRNRVPAALALAGALALVPAAVAHAASGPDLRVTSVTVVGLHAPDHLPLGSSGVAQRYVVRFVVANGGDQATTVATTARLFVSDVSGKRTTRAITFSIPPLPSHFHATRSATISGSHPQLGIFRPTVIVDPRHLVAEASERNNTGYGPRIAVLARTWLASSISTVTTSPTVDHQTRTGEGFHFRFTGYDPHTGWEYGASGLITDTATGKICTGTASADDDRASWGTDELVFGTSLTTYVAEIATSRIEPTYDITCQMGFPPLPVQWQDIYTNHAFRTPLRARAGQGSIKDDFTQSTPAMTTVWKWWLLAEVPTDQYR